MLKKKLKRRILSNFKASVYFKCEIPKTQKQHAWNNIMHDNTIFQGILIPNYPNCFGQ